jgi:hypothetical protein
VLPAKLFALTEKAASRVIEFFTAQINNEPTLTIKLYDRRFDETSLDEVEKISI